MREKDTKTKIQRLMRGAELRSVLEANLGYCTSFDLQEDQNLIHFKGKKMILTMPLDKVLTAYEGEPDGPEAA